MKHHHIHLKKCEVHLIGQILCFVLAFVILMSGWMVSGEPFANAVFAQVKISQSAQVLPNEINTREAQDKVVSRKRAQTIIAEDKADSGFKFSLIDLIIALFGLSATLIVVTLWEHHRVREIIANHHTSIPSRA